MDLLERIKAILVTPEREWPLIAREPDAAWRLLTHYVAILALVPPLAHVIGASLVGAYAPILSSLAGAVITYVASFVAIYGAALIIDVLAPAFGARKNFSGAFKLAVYSATPAWLAGIFLIVPGLSFLAVLGLYGAYLLWVGLPVLMQAPNDRTLAYAAAATGCALVIAIGLGLLELQLLDVAR
jgi:hypothetical protein